MIVDLGVEKMITCFIGPAEQVAFNRSVLDAALAAFDAETLLSGPLPDVSAMTWTADAFPVPDVPMISLPSGGYS